MSVLTLRRWGEPIAAIDPALARSVHEELLEALTIHGRVVFTSVEDRNGFVDQIAGLPSNVGKLWEALISSGRIKLEVLDPPVNPGLAQSLDVRRSPNTSVAASTLFFSNESTPNCWAFHQTPSAWRHPEAVLNLVGSRLPRAQGL